MPISYQTPNSARDSDKSNELSIGKKKITLSLIAKSKSTQKQLNKNRSTHQNVKNNKDESRQKGLMPTMNQFGTPINDHNCPVSETNYPQNHEEHQVTQVS